MLCSNIAFAQTTVTGTVVDTKGDPMPGAKVQVKGTNEYVITNMDGTFSMQLDNPKSKLVSQYVGWNTEIKKAKDGMTIIMGKTSWWKQKPQKYQWFVGANVALPGKGSDMFAGAAPGIMFGRVKNIGWYVKGQFNGTTDSHDCSTGTTGKTKTNLVSATLGGIVRLASPIHFYAGVGYMEYDILDEHACGGYSSRKGNSHSFDDYMGVDAGFMVRYKHLLVQTGAQWLMHHDQNDMLIGNFGVGYIF